MEALIQVLIFLVPLLIILMVAAAVADHFIGPMLRRTPRQSLRSRRGSDD